MDRGEDAAVKARTIIAKSELFDAHTHHAYKLSEYGHSVFDDYDGWVSYTKAKRAKEERKRKTEEATISAGDAAVKSAKEAEKANETARRAKRNAWFIGLGAVILSWLLSTFLSPTRENKDLKRFEKQVVRLDSVVKRHQLELDSLRKQRGEDTLSRQKSEVQFEEKIKSNRINNNLNR